MYTQGKWEYHTSTGGIYAKDRGIARVLEAGTRLSDCTDEGQANARLIAHAPEMFEVLEQARRDLRLPSVETHKVADRIDKLLADITRLSNG